MIHLPDINVWIALAVAEHVHYEPAAEWLREPLDSSSKDEIAFCRVTQMGFLRLLTSPKAMGKDALTVGQAWDFLDGLRNQQKFIFADEPSNLELEWRSPTHGRHSIATGSWTDAYLAAFAATAGYTLATFDRGLARRVGVQSPLPDLSSHYLISKISFSFTLDI
jgi:uncharacterized protein